MNVEGTRTLVAALTARGCRRLVFSSSAAIYGPPEHLPIREDHPLNPATPYGATKRDAEKLLADAAAVDPGCAVALLRYFNPAGAHDSARLGEIPAERPVNLMPNLIAATAGLRPALTVYGVDWDTPDGTGVRDYIHIVDLARAHLAALDWTGRAEGRRGVQPRDWSRSVRARTRGSGGGVERAANADCCRAAPGGRRGERLGRSVKGRAAPRLAGRAGGRRDLFVGLGVASAQRWRAR